MYQALASISGDDQIFWATPESIICHLATFWNGDARKAGAIPESIIFNLRNRFWDGDAREARATIESKVPNLCYRWRDGNARKAGAIRESPVPNLRYRWRDNTILAASYECIALSMDYGIAVLA